LSNDNSKKGTEKSLFFELEEGTESPKTEKSVPEKAPEIDSLSHELTQLREEPVFTVDSQSLYEEFKFPVSEPKVSEEAHALKSEIDKLTHTPSRPSSKNEDIELLRKYISLKEAEAKDLKELLQQYQGHFKKISKELDKLVHQNRELARENQRDRDRVESVRAEIQELKAKHKEEINTIKNAKEDEQRRLGNYDKEINDLMEKREEWRQKVKEELKRIKLKERELENKYDLLKRDSQALLDSKDKHVLELKKKNDALELAQESLEDKLRQSNSILADIDSKKKRLVETLKLTLGLLEGIDPHSHPTEEDSDFKPKKAG
jgi:DNA repair exonuclease SbcCD ATPase subunit